MFRKLMKRKYNSVVLTQVLRRIVELEALKRVHKHALNFLSDYENVLHRLIRN